MNQPSEQAQQLAFQRDHLMRSLTLIEHHARQTREFLAVGVSFAEQAEQASSMVTPQQMAEAQARGQRAMSAKDMIGAQAAAMQGKVNAHLATLIQACRPLMGGAAEPEQASAGGPKLALAE